MVEVDDSTQLHWGFHRAKTGDNHIKIINKYTRPYPGLLPECRVAECARGELLLGGAEENSPKIESRK